MNYLKAIVKLLLSLMIVFVTLGYTFYQPFEAETICSAIPDSATSVYKINNTVELLNSPLVTHFDEALGGTGKLEKMLRDNKWFQRFTRSEVAIAGLPARYPDQQKPLVVTSWIGWRSPWFRWKLEQTRVEGLKRVEPYNVWPVWTYTGKELKNDCTLRFSLTDKLFIACLSDEPMDFYLLLDTYDKRLSSVQNY